MKFWEKWGLGKGDYWLGIEAQGTQWKVILLSFHRFKVKIELEKICEDRQALLMLLRKYSSIPILLYAPELSGVEKCIPLSSVNLVKEVLGMSVERPTVYFGQYLLTKDEAQWVKLARKDDLMAKLNDLKEIKEDIVSVSIMSLPVLFLIENIEGYQKQKVYQFEGYFWQDGILSSPTPEAESLSHLDLASSLSIDPNFLELYGAVVFHYLSQGRDLFQLEDFDSKRKNYKRQKGLLKWLQLGLLISLLALGLATFFEEFWLAKRENQTKLIESKKEVLEEVKLKQNQVAHLRKFLSQKVLKSSHVAIQFDALSIHIPKEIVFDKLWFRPRIQQLKKLDPELREIRPDILLEGHCSKVSELLSFIQQVERETKFTDVSVWNSAFDELREVHQFTLTINDHED
ncbi:MAG: hypothetical protein AAFY71_19685 [Bacteroidota bacterium]